MIKFEDVSLCLGNRTILQNISFEVNRGETVLLVGSSGAGKSTILRLIIGLLDATGGKIFVDGRDINTLSGKELNTLRKKFSLVFQHGALFDSLTIEDNVIFFLVESFNMPYIEAKEKVKEIIQFFNLEHFAQYYPSQISGGMKKRVSIARAVVTEPEVILYDEPTAGLDPFAAKKVVELIVSLQSQFNVTSLIVTHEIHHFVESVDRLIMLKNSKITYNGKPDLNILKHFEESERQLECLPKED